MAGFSLEVNDAGIAVPSYVAPANTSTLATTVGGLAGLGESLLGVEAARNRAAQAAEPTQTEINRGAQAALAEGLYSLSGVTDPAAVRAGVGQLVSDFEVAGFQIGSEEVDMIRRTTGVDVSVIDPMEAAANTMMKTLGENPQYIALAERDLRLSGGDYTEQDVLGLAYRIYQNEQADLLAISTYKNRGNADFPAFESRANSLIGSLTQVALEGLAIEARGGDVSTESILNLENNLAVLRAVLAAPAGVDASLYAPISASMDALDSLITQVKSVDARNLDLQATEMLQTATRVLLAQAESGGADAANAALAASALQTPEGRTQFFTANADIIQSAIRKAKPEVLAAVGQVGLEAETLDFTPFNDILNPPQPETAAEVASGADISEIATATSAATPEVTVTTLPSAGESAPAVAPATMPILDAITITTDGLHNPSFLERLGSPLAYSQDQIRREQEAGLTASDRVNLIDVANGLMVASTNGQGIQNPDVRNGFVGGVGQITAAIATTDRLFEPQYLEGVFSPAFFSTLNALKTIDPAAHALAQERVQNALAAQYGLLAKTSEAALSRSNLNVDASGNLSVNPDTGVFSRGEINAVNNYASEYYNGSLAALLNDRGRLIPSPNARSWATSLANDYAKLRDAIAAQRAMAGLLNRAGIPQNLIDQIFDEATAPAEAVAPAPAPVEATVPAEATAPTEDPLASMGVQGSGTREDPITFTSETGMTYEMYQAVPAEAYYRDPTGLLSQKRAGSRVTNNDRGDGDPLGSGTIVEDRLGTVAADGSRERPIQPFWDTMSVDEAYNRIPNNVHFIDPQGVVRFKGQR